jgi:uncharacterized protein YndB with AHSA1/START domain
MTEPTVQVSKLVEAPPERVWKALTTPELLQQYFLGAEVESDWRVGGPIKFRGQFKGQAYEDKGTIEAFDQPRHLSYTHYSPLSGKPDVPENYHRVEIFLAPRSKGTQVTLTQSNLVGGPTVADEKMRPEFEKNWSTVLDGLQRVVER